MHVSLSDKIAGTVSRDQFSLLEGAFAEDHVRDLLPQCGGVLGVLSKVASSLRVPTTAAERAKVASAARVDVVQVRPTRYGYSVKWAAAPDGVQPQE